MIGGSKQLCEDYLVISKKFVTPRMFLHSECKHFRICDPENVFAFRIKPECNRTLVGVWHLKYTEDFSRDKYMFFQK